MIKRLVDRSVSTAIEDASHDRPKLDFRCRWIDCHEALEAIYESWERLLNVSTYRNLLMDPDFIIPAFKHLGDSTVRFLVVEAPQKSDPNTSVLCGLIPFQKRKVYGLPFRCLEIWQHDHCFDCTPLLRVDCAREVLESAIEFLVAQEKISLLSLNFVTNEGEFPRVLNDVLWKRNIRPFLRESFTRAAFKPEIDSETYFQRHVSRSVKRNFRKMCRRLEEKGTLEFRSYGDGDSTDQLTKDFLRLEASGWKGKQGTALACDKANMDFFEDMVARSHRNGKLTFFAVESDGVPIAILCDLYSRECGFAYKTAYDDAMRDFTPGLLAEVKNIDYMHGLNIQTMDSCTDPDNETLNRIWRSRIRLQSMVIPIAGGSVQWATTIMPLMQKLRHVFSSGKLESPV